MLSRHSRGTLLINFPCVIEPGNRTREGTGGQKGGSRYDGGDGKEGGRGGELRARTRGRLHRGVNVIYTERCGTHC